MTITADTFERIETRVVALLAAAGIPAQAWETVQLDQVPLATLSLPAPLTTAYDAGTSYGIGGIQWTLHYYVDYSEGEQEAQHAMKTGIAAIWNALAADRYLDGVARWSEIGGGKVIPLLASVASAAPTALMYEASLTVTPHPNMAE